MLHVDMDVDSFAEFVFMKNKNNAMIDLSLGGVENNKDLFCFLVDLFCKGLVIMFGINNRVELERLTTDDFVKVKTKMLLAGIEVLLNFKENTMNAPVGVNIRDIEFAPENDPLPSYSMKAIGDTYIYEIRFNLTRVPV